MSFLSAAGAEDVIDEPAKVQFEGFLDEHRGALNRCLDGLTEEDVRRSLVPSRTTLLGPLPLRWVYLHMLRELAQHCGHADILREQLLSR